MRLEDKRRHKLSKTQNKRIHSLFCCQTLNCFYAVYHISLFDIGYFLVFLIISKIITFVQKHKIF